MGLPVPAKETTLSGRPVVALSVAINYAAGGKHPAGYHAMNMGIHVLNGWLLYGLLVYTLRTVPVARPVAGQAQAIGLATAAIWLVHPLQTEAVTYISGRSELIVATFYLATLYCAARAGEGRSARGWTIGAVVCCGLGMASKEVMVTAPLMVVAYDLALRGEPWRVLLRRRAPLYALLAATWGILAALMLLDPRNESVGFRGDVAAWQYAAAQCEALITYARLAVWPTEQCFDYGYVREPDGPAFVLGALLVAATLAVIVWGWLRQPVVGLLATWPALILLPTSSVVPIYTQVAAERRMYLPLAALMLVLVLLGAWALVRLTPRGTAPARTLLAIAGCCPLLLIAATVSRQRNALCLRPEQLWRQTLAVRPENARAWHQLSDVLVAESSPARLEEAVECYRRAVELRPNYSGVFNNLGATLAQLGRSEEAIAAFRRSIDLDPQNPALLANLADALARLGHVEQPRQLYQRAIMLAPANYQTHLDYGRFLMNQDEYSDALAAMRMAYSLNPNSFATHRGVAGALAGVGDLTAAVAEMQVCVERYPREPDAWWALAELLAMQGQTNAAIGHLHTCLQLAPDHAPARNRLNELIGTAPRDAR